MRQRFALNVSLAAVLSLEAVLRHIIVGACVEQREIPIALAAEVGQTVAAHGPAVVEPPFGEVAVIGAEFRACFGIILFGRRENHRQILHFVPIHRDTVVENQHLVARRHYESRVGSIRISAPVITLFRHGYVAKLGEVGFFLAAIVGDFALVPGVHVLLVHADYDNTGFLEHRFVVVNRARLGVERQAVEGVVGVGGVFVDIVAQSVHGGSVNVADVDVRHRVEIARHVGEKAHVNPLLEVVLDDEKHVGTALRGRNRLNQRLVVSRRLGGNIHGNVVFLAVGLVKLLGHQRVDFQLRFVAVNPELDGARSRARVSAASAQQRRAEYQRQQYA